MLCKGLIEDEHGPLFAQKCWREKVLDFGTQNLLSIHPTLIFPMNNFHELEWVDGKTLQAYSSFGKLGGGFGGLQVSGKVGEPCQKLTSYCGKWVHQLKAAGMPRCFCSEAMQPAVGGPPTPEVDVLCSILG